MIFTPAWWTDALVRAGRTALVLLVPYLTIGARITEIDFGEAFLVGALGFIASLATSLKGLPETMGKPVPLWQALGLRAAKSFGQGVVTGIGAAALLTDVDWIAAVELGLGGALGSIVLGLLSTLPETKVPEDIQRPEVVFAEDAEVSDGTEYTRDVTSGYLDEVSGRESTTP